MPPRRTSSYRLTASFATVETLSSQSLPGRWVAGSAAQRMALSERANCLSVPGATLIVAHKCRSVRLRNCNADVDQSPASAQRRSRGAPPWETRTKPQKRQRATLSSNFMRENASNGRSRSRQDFGRTPADVRWPEFWRIRLRANASQRCPTGFSKGASPCVEPSGGLVHGSRCGPKTRIPADIETRWHPAIQPHRVHDSTGNGRIQCELPATVR